MDASNWINLGIMLLTGLGVVVAAQQAGYARGSAREAAEHEQAALQAAVDSANAHQRSAVALEKANALAEAQGTPPKWVVTQVDTSEYRIDHNGPTVAYEVNIEVPDYPEGMLHAQGVPRETLDSGLAITFSLFDFWGAPSDPILTIHWKDQKGGEDRTTRVTL
jgi:hypothetical protein